MKYRRVEVKKGGERNRVLIFSFCWLQEDAAREGVKRAAIRMGSIKF